MLWAASMGIFWYKKSILGCLVASWSVLRRLGDMWFLGACFLTPNPSKIHPKTSKIHPKSHQNPDLEGNAFWGGFLSQLCCVLGASWGRLERLLGRLWARPGASWGRLGASWARLGRVLGRLGRVLGASWARLGVSWAVLDSLWGVSGASWGVLGASWETKKLYFSQCFSMFLRSYASRAQSCLSFRLEGVLGASWGHLGNVLSVLGGVLGVSWGGLGTSWGVLGASWGVLGSSWASKTWCAMRWRGMV